MGEARGDLAQGQLEGRAELGKGEEVGLKSPEVSVPLVKCFVSKVSGQRQESPLGLANPYLLYSSLETFFYQGAQKWRLVEESGREVS